MGKEEAEDDAHVVIDTFIVHNTPSLVLSDSGATHSFVSRNHALAMGLGEYELVKDNVFIPSGQSVSCSKLYMDVSMIEWLGKYEAKIDCRQKRVSLKGPKGVKESSASDIPVVGEFGDVFLDEILGLPPKRDIDFSVELKLGT
ncbi:uncharacterized protein LOC141654988 [Silene latifolia]|uniref:uncharacterized protein LOC141654988 n=1 Tax=Silene latifolia TaxID=37657 RepID=UPI003D789DAF